MGAQYAIVGALDDQLHEAFACAPAQGRLHGSKLSTINIHMFMPSHGLSFGLADGGEFRCREYRGWHDGRQRRTGASGEYRFREHMTFTNGHRGQLDSIGHVADGVYAARAGLEIIADNDGVPVVGSDARTRKSKTSSIGTAADRTYDRIGGDHRCVGQGGTQALVGALNDDPSRLSSPVEEIIGSRA